VLNAITIDVEEYFHPSEVQQSVLAEQWTQLPPRVEQNIDQILELLDRHHCHGTFFILGWVADQFPEMIRRIGESGHEIGCHSYAHQLVYELTPKQFRADTLRAVRAIEDACGITPRVYRAPSYSITRRSMWALEILVECGFTHDSSIYPISHDRYGIPGFQRTAHMVATPAGSIYEVPVATVLLPNGSVAPVGGGAYLRLLPYRYTAAGIRRLNENEQQPACIYFHPWELDTGQPRLATGLLSRVRTYKGLRSMQGKLERLLTDFRFSKLGQVFPVASRLSAVSAEKDTPKGRHAVSGAAR